VPDDSGVDQVQPEQPGTVVRRVRAQIDRARDGDDVTALRITLGRALLAQTRFDEAARELEKVTAQPGVDPALQTAAFGVLAGALVLSGRPAEGEAVARRALASKHADAETRVLAHSAIRGLSFFEGRFDEAVLHARQIVLDAAGAGPLARGEARLDMGGMLFHADQFDEAEGWLALEADASESQRQEAAGQLALLNLVRGRWHDVLDAVPATSVGSEADWSDLTHVFRPSMRVYALIHLDRVEQARREMGRPVAHGAPPLALVASSMLAALDGDMTAAGALVERAVALNDRPPGQRPHLRLWALELVHLALAAGEGPTAERLVGSLEEMSARSAVPSVRAAALATRGMLLRDAALLEEAMDVFAGGPRKVATAQAADELGAVHRERGDEKRAVGAFRRALRIWESLGATHDVRQTARALRELGVRTRPLSRRRALRTGWESLSRTEATVAMLVGEGMTNAEIAARLVLSRRTVETHVAHVLGKLEVRTRSAVARLAAQRRD
jgi:DNA-binding CsgD family transcriptional regulator